MLFKKINTYKNYKTSYYTYKISILKFFSNYNVWGYIPAILHNSQLLSLFLRTCLVNHIINSMSITSDNSDLQNPWYWPQALIVILVTNLTILCLIFLTINSPLPIGNGHYCVSVVTTTPPPQPVITPGSSTRQFLKKYNSSLLVRSTSNRAHKTRVQI